jgi:hypothetical protein
MSYTVGIVYRYLSTGVILNLLNYVQLKLATISWLLDLRSLTAVSLCRRKTQHSRE